MEGSYNNDPSIGVWPITACRVARACGNIEESQWPYPKEGDWPPIEPPDVDRLAKANRISVYQRVKNIEECKEVIYRYGAVNIAVDITSAWRSAPRGRIQMPTPNEPIEGSHSFAVFAYDDAIKRFEFVNSWGVNWGDKGFGSLPYEYFERYFQEAWLMFRPSIKPERVARFGGNVFTWEQETSLHKVIHGIEITEVRTDERIGWAFAVEYDGVLNVEEFFIMPLNRRKGWAKILLQEVMELSDYLKIPLKFWISHADAKNENMRVIYKLARRIDFVVSDTDVCWASFEATKRKYPDWYYREGDVNLPLVGHELKVTRY